MTGSTDRDPALAAAIEGLPVPDHAEGFWDALTAQFHDRSGGDGPAGALDATGPAAAESLVDLATGRRPGAGPAPDQPGQGRLDWPPAGEAGRRPWVRAAGSDHRHWLLVAAVVALVGGIGIGMLIGTADRSRRNRIETIDPAVTTTPVVTDPAPPDDGVTPTTGAVPVPALGGSVSFRLGQAIQVGAGTVGGLTDDGRSAYLWIDGPSGAAGTGNECGSPGSLYLQPLGSTGRTRVGQPGQLSGPGPIVGPDGRIALLSLCEVTVGPVTVARVDGQGKLSGVKRFTLNPGFPGDNPYASSDWIRTVQWTRDGSALLLATGAGAYRVDLAALDAGPPDRPVSGKDLGFGPVVALGQGRNGELAVVLADGRVQLDGVTLGTVTVDPTEETATAPLNLDGASFGISQVAVDDRGVVWVASLRQGLIRLAPGRQPVVVDPLPASDVVPLGGGLLWKAVTGGPTAYDQGEIRTFGPDGVIALARDSAAAPSITHSLDRTGRAVLRITSSDGFQTAASTILPVEAGG